MIQESSTDIKDKWSSRLETTILEYFKVVFSNNFDLRSNSSNKSSTPFLLSFSFKLSDSAMYDTVSPVIPEGIHFVEVVSSDLFTFGIKDDYEHSANVVNGSASITTNLNPFALTRLLELANRHLVGMRQKNMSTLTQFNVVKAAVLSERSEQGIDRFHRLEAKYTIRYAEQVCGICDDVFQADIDNFTFNI